MSFLENAMKKLPPGGLEALPTDEKAIIWTDIKSSCDLNIFELSALKNVRCSGNILTNCPFCYYVFTTSFFYTSTYLHY
jgi:hypothetical protein